MSRGMGFFVGSLIFGLAVFGLIWTGESRKGTIAPPPGSGLVQAAADAVDPCKKKEFWVKWDALIGKWDDAVTLAEQTPRMAVADRIESLQAIRRELTAFEVPSCADGAKAHLAKHMTGVIDGFLLFLGKEEYASPAKFQEARDEKERFLQERARITGIPRPTAIPEPTP